MSLELALLLLELALLPLELALLPLELVLLPLELALLPLLLSGSNWAFTLAFGDEGELAAAVTASGAPAAASYFVDFPVREVDARLAARLSPTHGRCTLFL